MPCGVGVSPLHDGPPCLLLAAFLARCEWASSACDGLSVCAACRYRVRRCAGVNAAQKAAIGIALPILDTMATRNTTAADLRDGLLRAALALANARGGARAVLRTAPAEAVTIRGAAAATSLQHPWAAYSPAAVSVGVRFAYEEDAAAEVVTVPCAAVTRVTLLPGQHASTSQVSAA